ncbi:hypothetical protein [Streptomyces xanthophaeus]|uniref:hypothetical protein n=1 Tax=Streptomyces xanthophaeus TaxID=67385 RepID=UPI003F4CE8CC
MVAGADPDRLMPPVAGILYVLHKGVAWRDTPAQLLGRSGLTAWRPVSWRRAMRRSTARVGALEALAAEDLPAGPRLAQFVAVCPPRDFPRPGRPPEPQVSSGWAAVALRC